MQKEHKNKKKGISLIALVITIIVMIVLAAAVIISLGNSNIVDKANAVVSATDLKNVQTMASVAWAEAYNNGNKTEEELKSAVFKALEDNNVEISKYRIEVTDKGTDIIIETGWKYKADENGKNTIVTNGKVDLKIGSSMAYILSGPAADYKAGWQILGAEDGNLLILSTGVIRPSVDLNGRNGYTTAINKLDNLCKLYGYGSSATFARSIKVEDVNKITGYNPNNIGAYDPEHINNGVKNNANSISEYNNIVTYSSEGKFTLAEEYYPKYTSLTANGTLNGQTNTTFYWYDVANKSWQTSEMTTNGIMATLTNKSYSYYPTTLEKTNGPTINGISLTSEEYKMLFTDGKGMNVEYWLASPHICTFDYNIAFGLHFVCTGHVEENYLAFSNGTENNISSGVRAVIGLAPDINVSGNNTDGWSYN